MAIELATAYVSIVPSTKDLQKNLKAALRGADFDITPKIKPDIDTKGASRGADSFMSAFDNRAGRLAGRAGERIGQALTTAMRRTALAGATAVAGAVGATLFKGFERYKSLDATAKRLGAMGKTASQVKSIMDDINEVVQGTPIALDAASASATQFLQGGVKEGEELKSVLTAIADASGASGTAFDDLAIIFGQVMNKGKFQAEEMLQLNERGIGIQAALRKEFGWTGDELQKLSKDGKITFQQLVQAVEGSFGGMAKRAGDSVEGAIGNMKTAVGRVGANLLATIFGDPLSTTEGPGAMAASIGKVTERLDNLNAWVGNNGDQILGFFANMGMAAVTMGQVVVGAFTYISRGIGWTVNVFGDILGGMTKALSGINRVLGRDEIADQLAEDAEGMFGWGDALLDAANKSDQAFQSLDKMFFSIADWKADTQEAAKFTHDLGKAVAEIADRDVILKTPSKEDLDKLDKAKWAIINIPDSKDVIIRPKTGEAAAEINSWREAEGKKPVVFFADANMTPAETDAEAWRKAEAKNPATIPVDADTAPAAATMNAFIDSWTKGITVPVAVVPGQGAPGQNPLDIFAPGGPGFSVGGAKGPPALGGGGNSLGKRDSGGVMQPNAAATKSYFEGLGFTVGGYSPADSPEDEHQTGEATDVMVPSLQAGYSVLPNAIRRPGVQYIIFDNKMWYPDGSTKPYSGPSPHTDHLHIRQKADGGGVRGPGGPKSDKIPAMLSNGEHVLTAADVAAMGGQGGVYAFRNALHRKTGGEIRKMGAVVWPREPVGPTDPSSPGGVPDLRGGNVAGPHLPDWGPGAKFGPPAGDWWLKPVDPDDILFPEWLGPGYPWKHPYDDDRIRPFAEGGAVEGPKIPGHGLKWDPEKGWVETGEPGIPLGVPHEGTGKPPGPEQLLGFPGPVAPGRTEGYIPAAAGNTGKTGGGVAGSLINLGAEAAKGAIQAAADLGKMAASAAAAGATGGAGAAAGPAAGAGIQIGADIAKRGVDWAAEMGNIGVGFLSEQLFPFGAPRWLSDVDPTGFMPQLGINPALTTTGEAAIEAIAQQSAVDPMTTTHGQGQGAPPGPQAPALPEPPGLDFLSKAIQPGEPPVPPPAPPMVNVEAIHTQDPSAVGQSIAKAQRLEMMRFAGRP